MIEMSITAFGISDLFGGFGPSHWTALAGPGCAEAWVLTDPENPADRATYEGAGEVRASVPSETFTIRLVRSILLVIALGLMPTGPSLAGDVICDPGSEAAREVRQVVEGIIDADNARDLERVLGYYAAAAVLMPPGEASVTGLQAIRPRYEKLFAEFDPAIEAEIREICAGERLAVVRGHNGGRLISRRGEAARDLDDVYLMVLQRLETGEWRISHLVWHPAGPKKNE